jgi:hypothetical protein
MRVASLKCRFTAERVREIPDVQGVFTLWDGKECVYVAHTPWNRSLQQCLRESLALNDRGAIHASHFSWETSSTPKGREHEVLRQKAEKQGRLPRYNLPGSPLAATRSSITDLRAPG